MISSANQNQNYRRNTKGFGGHQPISSQHSFHPQDPAHHVVGERLLETERHSIVPFSESFLFRLQDTFPDNATPPLILLLSLLELLPIFSLLIRALQV